MVASTPQGLGCSLSHCQRHLLRQAVDVPLRYAIQYQHAHRRRWTITNLLRGIAMQLLMSCRSQLLLFLPVVYHTNAEKAWVARHPSCSNSSCQIASTVSTGWNQPSQGSSQTMSHGKTGILAQRLCCRDMLWLLGLSDQVHSSAALLILKHPEA